MIESSYTKLFSSIVTSTIWREDDKTRIVWITLLALKNRHGQVAGSVPGLAAMANVCVADCELALAKLASPDGYSRSKEFEGRRIEATDGGWTILNHAKYRECMSVDERRAYQAEWQKGYRQRKKAAKSSTALTNSVDTVESTLTHTDADADAEGTKHERESGGASCVARPGREEVLAHAAHIGLAEWKALDWLDEMEGCGWIDYNHRPVMKWQSLLTRVCRKWEADGRPTAPPSAKPQVNGQSQHKRPLSPLDISTIIKAKEVQAGSIKQRHCSEVAMGSSWTDEKARQEFFKLKREIKRLNHQLSSMA